MLENETKKKIRLAVLAIIVFAFVMRVMGVDFGLPYLYHPDEATRVNGAVRFGSGDLNPHYFLKPSLLTYSLFILYGIYFVFGYVFGAFESVAQFARHFITDPTNFYLIGRMVSVLSATYIVYLTYCLGRKTSDFKVAIIAMFLVAINYTNITNAHYVATDVPMTMFILLSFYFSYGILHKPNSKSYIFAGVFAGLAAGTKYPGGAVLFSAIAAYYMANSELRLKELIFNKRLLYILLGFTVAFFIFNPYVILDYKTFFKHFKETLGLGYSDKRSIHRVASLGNFLGVLNLSLGQYALGGFSFISFIYYAIKNIKKRNNFDIILFIFVLIYSYAFARSKIVSTRYMICVIPIFYLFAARLIVRIYDSIKLSELKKGALMAIFIVAATYPMYVRSIYFNKALVETDSRTLAKEWVESNIPQGTKILLDPSGPLLDDTLKNLTQKYERAKERGLMKQDYYKLQIETVESKKTYDYVIISSPVYTSAERTKGNYEYMQRHELLNHDLNYFRNKGFKYVIISSFMYDEFYKERQKKEFPAYYNFYESLKSDTTRMKTFEGYPRVLGPHQPKVIIYKL